MITMNICVKFDINFLTQRVGCTGTPEDCTELSMETCGISILEALCTLVEFTMRQGIYG